MLKSIRLFLFGLLLTGGMVTAQNTVGVLSFDGTAAFPGYNVVYPIGQGGVYLLDNCGRVVHSWPDTVGVGPGNTVYLREDGSIVKAKRDLVTTDDIIDAGGRGEFIEIRDWDNNVTWTYELNDSTYRLHHDATPMPNGNILAIAWERFSYAEAVAAGRDTSLLKDGELWGEAIFEIEPVGTNNFNIVWEWHSWDHMVQDYDSTQANFGVVAQNPNKIDVNYVGVDPGEKDWLHFNSIDYNPTLDQIAISCPEFNEVWIIDHSTTTAQAAGSIGGLAKRGGDLIYRWGNPMAYDAGDSTNIQMYYQHDIHWIAGELSPTNSEYGKLMLFSNRHPGDVSQVQIIEPVFSTYDWEYELSGGTYLPAAPDYIYASSSAAPFYSNILSSAQLLPNGNILIGSGRPGYAVEIDDQENIVWEYKNPLQNGVAASQGDTLSLSSNMVFRYKRFSASYGAFNNRELIPGDLLEVNGDTALCAQLALDIPEVETGFVSVYPNPTRTSIHLSRTTPKTSELQVISLLGRVEKVVEIRGLEPEIDLSDLAPGIYVLRVDEASAKIIVE